MSRPEPNEYDPYYEQYVSLVPEDRIVPVLAAQPAELNAMFAGLPEERGLYTYADGKWTIKELLGHIIDGERMFAYRVLRISRGDKTPIEGFEQDGYIENAYANERTFGDLLREFSLIREANVMLFDHIKPEMWKWTGTANDVEISVRALIWIMAGHVRHHVAILNERYLTPA
jgi:hypothetical protein